jgi:hypothetical protein
MKKLMLITVLMLFVAQVSHADDDDGHALAVGGTLLAINALVGTANGIQAFSSPPQRGPVLFGVVFGVASLIVGPAMMAQSDSGADSKYFAMGAVVTAAGAVGVTLAFLNGHKYSKRSTSLSLSPHIGIDPNGGRRVGAQLKWVF